MNFKKGDIEGVLIKRLTKYTDERGCLVETFREDTLPDRLKLAMCYVAFTKPGVARGPHEHLKQTDVSCFIGPGSFKIKLWNNRKSCKTYGSFMEITGGRDNPILVIIPPGIVHGYKNISEDLGMVINYSDKLYKGWNKEEEVDEIRHEDVKDDFYLDFVSEDNLKMLWLIGNKGMLGQEVEKLLKRKRLSYLASDKEVDITNYSTLKEFTKNIKLAWIINCSGYTDADKAEKEIEKAFLINRDGVKNISKIATEKQAKLVHISTDYIFNGKKDTHLSYTEDDKTEPINIYGESKLAGEREIKRTLKKYFIIRTAWLYGRGGKNFVSTMLKLFKEKEEIKVVSDQWGSPTYTVDLAEVILKMINNDSDKFGVYHFTNEGVTNWYEFAREIYRKSKKLGVIDSNKEVKIRAIETKEYPTPTQRPKCSWLSKEKIKRELSLDIRNWEDALTDFLSFLSL